MPELPVEITIQEQGLSGLLRGVKEFDQDLAKNLRRRIRDVAKEAVADARSTVLAGDYKTNTGLRLGIAAGIGVRISTPKKGEGGVSIVAGTSRLRSGKAPMVKAFNRVTFRHPVLGSDTWVEQAGRPYFGVAILSHRQKVQDAVQAAMEDATQALADRVK